MAFDLQRELALPDTAEGIGCRCGSGCIWPMWRWWGDDLLGDGVNVAARIEGVTPPGEVLVSRQSSIM